jgi:solute carrier family 25 protein 34/35
LVFRPPQFLFGGLSTCIACVFSNPFDVAKTRMQLQGERQAFGTYERHYRNVFHSLSTIARVEGWSGLQRGLGPGMVYAFVMNGVRLGTYQSLTNVGWTTDPSTGKPSFGRAVLAGALAGGLGGAVASPLYLVGRCCGGG